METRKPYPSDVTDDGWTFVAPYLALVKVVKPPGTRRGFVLLPRRWVIVRSFAWKTRFRRLSTLAGLHHGAFACLALTAPGPSAGSTVRSRPQPG
jgi:hypothetical protein